MLIDLIDQGLRHNAEEQTVRFRFVAGTDAAFADFVGAADLMQQMIGVGLFENHADPLAVAHGVAAEVEHHRDTEPKQRDDMRRHHLPPSSRRNDVLGERRDRIIEAREPLVFADENSGRRTRDFSCQSRLACARFPRNEVQGRHRPEF